MSDDRKGIIHYPGKCMKIEEGGEGDVGVSMRDFAHSILWL